MAATLQRESFGGIIFVIITKKITKVIVAGDYFVIISARMVFPLQIQISGSKRIYSVIISATTAFVSSAQIGRAFKSEKRTFLVIFWVKIKRCSVDISDIFYFSARGKGEREAPGGGWGDFLWKIPGSPARVGGGGGAMGREVVCVGIWGGGG